MVIWFTRRTLRKLQVALSEAQRDLADLRESSWKLESRVRKQAQVIEALTQLLCANEQLSQEQLIAKVQEIAAVKKAAMIKVCSKCGKSMNEEQLRCIYCGESRAKNSVADLF